MGNLLTSNKNKTLGSKKINAKTCSILPLIRSIGQSVDLQWLFTNRNNIELHDLYVNTFYSKNLPCGFFETCDCDSIMKILNIRMYVRKFIYYKIHIHSIS